MLTQVFGGRFRALMHSLEMWRGRRLQQRELDRSLYDDQVVFGDRVLKSLVERLGSFPEVVTQDFTEDGEQYKIEITTEGEEVLLAEIKISLHLSMSALWGTDHLPEDNRFKYGWTYGTNRKGILELGDDTYSRVNHYFAHASPKAPTS